MPLKPSDPAKAMKYSRQIIFTLDSDSTTLDNAKSLQAKRVAAGDGARSSLLDWSDKEKHQDLTQVPPSTRLYLVGHGSEDSRTVGGWTSDQLGRGILTSLNGQSIDRISLYSCYGAGNVFGERETDAGIKVHGRESTSAVPSCDSFAAKLTAIVGRQVKSVTARTVRVHREEFAEKGFDNADVVGAYDGLFEQLGHQPGVATLRIPLETCNQLRRIPGLPELPPGTDYPRAFVTKQLIPQLEAINNALSQRTGQVRVVATRSFVRIVPGTYDTINRPKSASPGWHETGTKVVFTLTPTNTVQAKFFAYPQDDPPASV